ncbi:PREDICTED: protein prune homolog 2 [Nicrophorus vespilloides]|uniref:Protein prune homolog 2 n=1 Tax=Nicrophorus vespilloides TaxID=110193 RepID=A0ABM1NBQ9_NICVS|nr:PREDICTED: protein prune homolog 2 [Nicrophorus vespilloides]
MSEEFSPGSEKMDISEASDGSFPQYSVESTEPVLRLSEPLTIDNDNERLDNSKQYEESSTIRTNKNTSLTKNATNSHPLMYTSPRSPMSPDFPDLIPEKPKSRVLAYERYNFHPVAHSSGHLESSQESQDIQFDHLNLESPKLEDYTGSLPESPTALKKSLQYEMPQELSQADLSDNENDKSIYEAHLSSNLQNVSLTMNEKEGNLNFLAHGKQSNKLRRIKVVPTELDIDSDLSSLGSSPDSLKSEDVFKNFQNRDEQVEADLSQSRNESPEPIEPLSADDERRHARFWQRMVLPGGEQRTIDMRVIEPYKRVLSHGGYLRAGGHTAIVIFSACFLPDKSRCDYDYVMDNLFLYVLWTLERLVTEDYVLVYLHGGGSRLPSFKWIKRCYQMVGRKLRKNVSHLYIVHPTLLIKTMFYMAKPFVSAKFYRKISFIASLKELKDSVPIELAAIPDKVKAYDDLHCH